MFINTEALDKSAFTVKDGPGGIQLVTPNMTKHKWAQDERHLRSILVAPSGRAFAAGFPKFLNYDEDREHHNEVIAQAKQTYVTTKEDGTLIIAWLDSQGEIRFRTRGQFDLGDFAEDVMPLVTDDIRTLIYRLAASVQGHGQRSVLFEYVGPKNRIVLPYAKAELILLGHVDIKSDRLVYTPAAKPQAGPDHQRILERWAEEVKHSDLKFEGYVMTVVDEKGQATCIKFKTDWYCRLHALTSLSESALRKAFISNNVLSYDQYKSCEFFDWETQAYLESAFDLKSMLTTVAERATHAKAVMDLQVTPLRALERKQAALRIKQDIQPELVPCAFMHLNGNNITNHVYAYAYDLKAQVVASLRHESSNKK